MNKTAIPALTLADRMASLRRRRVPMLLVFSATLLVALLGAFLWPATYRSTGTILIEQQEVPMDLVRSMVSSYADQRIQVISQRVMTSENLMRIVDRYELYPERRRKETREAIVARLRDDIHFQMISADVVDPRLGRPTKATIAFSVSYDNHLPTLSAKVANEITTLYLNENLASRKQTADNTASFLTDEADRLNKEIAELDSKLSTFKEQHAKSLPQLGQLNLQLMERTADEMRETDTRIRSLDQQIVYLDAQLAQLQPASQIYTSTGERVMSPADRLKMLKSDYSRASSIYSDGHPDVVRLKREMEAMQKEIGDVESSNDLSRQLTDAQGELATARKKYGAEHPDVVRLERLVASIETAMQASPLITPAAKQNADNPAYIQVQAQREASVNERESLQRKRATLSTRIGDFEQRLSSAPEVEREYSALARDLDNAQLKYRETRAKQMEATLAKNLETERRGERFTLIEPPIAPQEPVRPNRPAIVAVGLLLAIGAAIGVALLIEALDGTVRNKRDIENLLTVAPLAILPWMETNAEREMSSRLRRLSFVGVGASIVVAVVLTHFLYRPLDVLWQVALRRLMN